ncbi:MAG: hypothetical protein ACOC2W_01750 [bacterium]
MKFKTLIPIVMMVMLIANVSAISYDYPRGIFMEMEPTDIVYYPICVYEDEARTIPIPNVVPYITGKCIDGDGGGACGGDSDVELDTNEFNAYDPSTTNGDGCAYFTLETNNAQRDQHYAFEVYFYTPEGGYDGPQYGAAYVPAEEEPPVDDVPEFSVIASLAVIGLAGLFIYKKRKNL